MNKYLFLLVGLMCYMTIAAQSVMKPYDKVFNFGVKVGLRSIHPDISSIKLDGVAIENISLKHYVGYTAEFLIRVNIDRFFIQPSASWNFSQSDVLFDIFSSTFDRTDEWAFPQSISMKITSLEVPVVIGYHLVKESPYVLSIMSGIKMKYNYDLSFTSNERNTSFIYNNNSFPYHWAVCTALEVLIGKLTFGVGYEVGFRRIHSNFDSYSYHKDLLFPSSMHMSKRLNGLSMSVGIMF